MTRLTDLTLAELNLDALAWNPAVTVERHGASLAVFSADTKYRYVLTREWDVSRTKLVVIGLNPSTATAEFDDPTIRRCMGFAKREGYGGLVMLNLFAYRATDPRDMADDGRAGVDIIGPLNDDVFMRSATLGRVMLAAWGANAQARDRGRALTTRLLNRGVVLNCLGRTRLEAAPRHPLYVKGDQPFEAWA